MPNLMAVAISILGSTTYNTYNGGMSRVFLLSSNTMRVGYMSRGMLLYNTEKIIGSRGAGLSRVL